MTSFIPLVQQKQLAAVVTGKRDIKVKALEAAETAKRLAQKKENERKMKKEALKLERSRKEQANMRQMEEDMRVRNLRMKQCIRQRRKKGNLTLSGTFQRLSLGIPRFQQVMLRESVIHEEHSLALSNFGYNAEVLSNVDKAIDNGKSAANTHQEQSYEISPYKESDDENEEDDDVIPNSKFVPSWSSKNCLALAVSCQTGAEPGAIFPLESFCSISEVLLPRKHHLNYNGMR
ncbi:uncharacterized protein Pyn_05655 [Prunus yedoensis var. nudiflora]|uniref:Uncharacterized protein n=1 Tax=Prunus yedoensis var. nudiflora TaxID=2094558 RepID=A0A314UDI3_PRUYE|nr:uncharacterized protein Pyn_05655 [Prunus yedoensis var. nudiflora]